MRLATLIPALVALVGLVVYVLATKPEASTFRELGRVAYFCGLLVLLAVVSGVG